MIAARTSRALAAVGVLVALGAAHTACAETSLPVTTVRSSNSGSTGRIVIDTTSKAAYTLDQAADHVVLRLTGTGPLGTPPALPRNVIGIVTDGLTLDLVLQHGARARPRRMGGRVGIDILEATGPAPTGHPARSEPQSRSRPPLSLASSADLGGRAAATTQAPTRAPIGAPKAAPSEAAPPRSVPPASVPAASVPPASVPAASVPPASVPPASVPPASVPAASAPPASVPAASVPAASAPPASVPAASVRPASAPPASVPPASVPPPAHPSAAPQTAAVPAVAEEVRQTATGRDVLPENEGPVGLRARRTRLPKDVDGTAFLVPFDSAAGAAAYQTGDITYVVFDQRRPVDMAALKNDPVFGAASVRLLPNGTLLRVPRPAGMSIALTQLPQGWRIAALAKAPRQEPIVAAAVDGRLNLAAEQPSDVVTMADPDSGATLLVGTQHRPGQGVASSRRSTEFILRPSIQGVVVEPLSDVIGLRQIPTGFTLSGSAGGLALSPPNRATPLLMDAAHLTRRLNFSTMPPEALMRLMVKQLGDAAGTPPLARGPRHHAAAETLLALGLSAEAEGLLHMTSEQDPNEASSPDTAALTAIAALMAGRPEESSALTDPKLDGTDEIALWRAVRQAMLDESSSGAAAVFAATAPLVFQYPQPIRNRILPLIAETMIQGGEIEPAARLLKQVTGEPRLAYARAMLSQAEGDAARALTQLDAVASSHDQFDRARAAIKAVELRLSMGVLDKTQAADALDKLLYAWRGDARELALRERVAELRGQTGAWRDALALLRQAETDFPDQVTPIHERLRDTFAAMVRDDASQAIPPLEFVAMVEENADLLRDTADDEAVEQPLADRLLALDLPGRARPVLEKLMHQAKSPTAKARFGAGLAMLESREGDDAGALSVLEASQSPDLPPELAEQRLIAQAAAAARLGDPAAAAARLVPLRTASATEARAQILETAADWIGAEQAWADCATLALPDSGALDEAQARIVLRLATATARAGDDAKLGMLRNQYGSRLGVGPLGDMFRLLTAEPIRTPADIGRSQKEVSLAASLPADLKALRSAGGSR